MLLFEFDVGKPWLDTSGITQQILLVHRVLVGLRRQLSAYACIFEPNGHIRSGKSPAGTQMFDPSVRAAGVISGAEVSLAYRHSVRARASHTVNGAAWKEDAGK